MAKKTVKIFVEGTADKKLLTDYINHIASGFELKDTIIVTGGWTNINSQS